MTQTIRGREGDLLKRSLNKEVLSDVRFFLEKINERNLFTRGLVERYEAPSLALGQDVEYFSSQITMDDRMVYIMNNIVTDPHLSMRNKVGNTVISHFYGARGIHSVITGETDPKKALVDFELIAKEQEKTKEAGPYTRALRERMDLAKTRKTPIWGTTELHTSIMGAGNSFVKNRYGPEALTGLAVTEWISSWVNTGYMDELISSNSLEVMFKNLIKTPGIGPYYGYHCATSNSVNPGLKFHHDEPFCSPGPGAIMTLDLLFPGLSKKDSPHGNRVIWIRENQDDLFPGMREIFHPATHNVMANGVKIFESPQDELKTYGTEVGLCQYSVYCRLRDNPHLVSKRKIARVEPVSCSVPLSEFFD